MAPISGLDSLNTPTLNPNPPTNAPDVGNSSLAWADGISKAQAFFNTGEKTLGEASQAYAKSDVENARKIVSSAVKLTDKASEAKAAAAKLKGTGSVSSTTSSATSTVTKASAVLTSGRVALAGAGLVASTVKGAAALHKTVNDLKSGDYGAAAVDGLNVASNAASAKSSIDTLRKLTGTAAKTAQKTEGVLESSAKWVQGTLSSTAKAGGEAAAHATTEAVVHTTAEVGAEVASKAAGRFVPGVNDVIAVADTAVAAKSWSDLANHKGSLGKAIGNSVTALGSIAAATNIPVVSQVGAAVSVVSSLITGFFVK